MERTIKTREGQTYSGKTCQFSDKTDHIQFKEAYNKTTHNIYKTNIVTDTTSDDSWGWAGIIIVIVVIAIVLKNCN